MSSSLSSDSANEENKETEPAPFPLKKHDIISSTSTQYRVLDFSGEGGFGSVAKSVNLTTNKLVAIKIHKNIPDVFIQREVKMLKVVRALDPEKKNIIEFLDYFKFNNFSCLAFEVLDKSLWDLMEEREGMPFTLNEIRPVTHQLLVAFEALKGIGILHTDLKPDNVMLVNHKDQPFKVKLIDFGLACPVSKVRVGMNMQAKEYRAPEVTLGLPLSEAIDMWGVGCILSFLYFSVDIFSGECSYHRMKAMVHMLGQPEDHVLSAGLNTLEYFSREEGSISPRWRLKSPEEYLEATSVTPEVEWEVFDIARNLEDAVHTYPEKSDTLDALEYEDRMAFLSLLKSCLNMDAAYRITPTEALKHPFITMVHLVDEVDTSSYADKSFKFMTLSPFQNLNESDDSLSGTETDTQLRDDQASDSSHGVSGTNSSSSEDEDIDTSTGNDADIESFSVGDSDIGSFSDVDSDTEISSDEDEDTDASSGYNADINNSSDEDDTEPATSDSYDGDSFNPSSSEKDNVELREPCFNFNEVSAPTGLESGSSTSSDGHSNAEISSHENLTGPSAATDLYDGVRDTTSPTKEESGDAATSNNDSIDTDYVPIASTTHDDRVSAAAGSTDGDAASITSNDGAAAAITPADVDDVKKKKKKKKNAFQRICKFFRRVVSIFNCRKI